MELHTLGGHVESVVGLVTKSCFFRRISIGLEAQSLLYRLDCSSSISKKQLHANS
ncbi:unnamed protein product [Brassica rapa subsp. narinosa]